MKLEELIVLLPCHSLEGYTLEQEADHADELLSAWSALYHPTLLAHVGALPKRFSAQEPPKDPAGRLIVVPRSSEKILPSEWLDLARNSGACVIRDFEHRQQIVDTALERLEGDPGVVDPQLAADFLALGFCHLQTEVMVRDAGYDMGTDVPYYDEQYHDFTGQFDREALERETVAAAVAALEGDEQTAKDQLRAAFTRLADARRNLPYTYSADVDPHLLDLTLVAPTTLGQSLREELAGKVPVNLLVSGQVIEQMAREQPATLAALREALSNNTAVIIGGEYDEQAIPLLAPEAIVSQLERGLAAYRRHLDHRPTIFGRRRFGLSPVLPQVLRKFGFVGALHFTLDDGHFPISHQSKIWWVGIDGTEVEALAQVPLDAARAASFLNFAGQVNNTSYQQYNATAVLAHWPGQVSPWYRDLQRTAAYSPALGEFRTVTEYLEQSQSISEWTRSGPDEYRSPYLRQAVARGQADPISRWVRHHRRRVAAEALDALSTMVHLVGGGGEPSPGGELLRDLEDLEAAESSRHAALDDELCRRWEETTGRFCGLVPREKGTAEEGLLAVNPWSFSRGVCVDVSALERLPAVGGAVRVAGEAGGRKQAVVQIPAMGFAWVGPGEEAPSPPEPVNRKKKRGKKDEDPPMVEENVLRNEFFEVTINPTTGAIQSIYEYGTRGNRLAQQIALRLPRSGRAHPDRWEADDPEKHYSIMAADEVSVTASGPVVGRIVSRGRLVDREGRPMAKFVQTVEARRGSRVLELGIDLDVQQQPGPDPWNSYYAARFAWGDATADVYRSVSLASRPAERPQLEAPHFVDIRTEGARTTILTGGLPYHRQFGLRKLDTLLVVRGETARSFRLGIGLGLKHPVPAALDFLAPQTVLTEKAAPPPGRSGWLFHLDARNVVATHWSPLLADGRVVGFRVRLLETEGHRGRAALRSFRPVGAARKVGFQEEQPTELSVQDDLVTIDIGAHEWVQVEAEFAG